MTIRTIGELINSMLLLVYEFGYVIIPIEEMSLGMKQELKISHYKKGDIVIVRRDSIELGEMTALKLGYVEGKHAVNVIDYESVIVFVVQDKPSMKKFWRKLFMYFNKPKLELVV